MSKYNIYYLIALMIICVLCYCSNPASDKGKGEPPAAPVISSVVAGDSSVTISWDTVAGASSYNLYFNVGATVDTVSGFKLIGVTSPTKLILAPGIQFVFAVSAINAAGESRLSALQTATLSAPFTFSILDTVSDTICQDTMMDKYYSDAFGPIPLSGTPVETLAIPLAGAYPAAAVLIPALPVTVKYVYKIDLMDTGQTLNVTVANNSAAIFSSVQITLGSLGTSTVSNLAGNSSGVAHFTPNGKVIDSVMNVSMTVTPAATGTFAAGNNLKVMFSLDGLTARKVDVTDSLLENYKRTFTNEYNLTDTMNVDYLDIRQGFFIYYVTNMTSIDLLLSVTHRNLWRSDFCQGHTPPFVSNKDLGGLTYQDSLNASNCDIAIRESFLPQSTNTYSRHNISTNRLFAEWNPTTKKSVTKVDYKLGVGIYGKRVTLSAGDSLSFVIKTTAFKFSEMYGRVTEQYKYPGAASTVSVNYPWTGAVLDSLRKKFVPSQVLANTLTRLNIPSGAFIDTVRAVYEISSVTNPALKCSVSTVFTHVTRDSLCHRPIDITSVLKDYPGSVNVKVAMTIPVGTPIKVVNDLTDANDPAYSKYMGRMIIHQTVDISFP
jgi:hypothetical protein